VLAGVDTFDSAGRPEWGFTFATVSLGNKHDLVSVAHPGLLPCVPATEMAAAGSSCRRPRGSCNIPFHGREGTCGVWLGASSASSTTEGGEENTTSSRYWFLTGAEDLQLKVCTFSRPQHTHGLDSGGATAPSGLQCQRTWHGHPGSVQSMACSALHVAASSGGLHASPAHAVGLVVTGGTSDTLHCWLLRPPPQPSAGGEGTVGVEWLCTRDFDETSSQDQRVKALSVFPLPEDESAPTPSTTPSTTTSATSATPVRFFIVISGNSEGLLMMCLVDTHQRRVVEVGRFRENSKPILALACLRAPVARESSGTTATGAGEGAGEGAGAAAAGAAAGAGCSGASGASGASDAPFVTLLVAGATNGCLSVWNLEPALQVARRAAAILMSEPPAMQPVWDRDNPCDTARAALFDDARTGGHPRLLSVFQAHAMGVNCVSAAVDGRYVVVASGGDGEELVLSRFVVTSSSAAAAVGVEMRVQGSDLALDDVSMTMQAGVSTAGLRGVHVDTAARVVFLSGTDQRVTVWSYTEQEEQEQEQEREQEPEQEQGCVDDSTRGWAKILWRGCAMSEIAAISSIDVLQEG